MFEAMEISDNIRQNENDIDNETERLISTADKKNNFDNLIWNYLIKQNINSSNIITLTRVQKLKNVSIHCLEGLAVLIGSFSGAPYIKPAREFAGEYYVFGYFLGYGVFTSLAVVTTWALLDITNAMYGQSTEEKEIVKRDFSIGKEIAYWMVMPLLGITTAFPVSYLMYKYNDQSLFFAGASIFTDSITNTCSLHEYCSDMKKLYQFYFGPKRVKILERIRFNFINQIEKSIAILPNLSLTDLQKLTLGFNNSSFDHSKFVYVMLELSKKQLQIEKLHRRWFQGVPKHLIDYAVILFPVAWMIFSVVNSAESFQLLWDNSIFDWGISIITSFPYLFLEFRLARAIFCNIYTFIIENSFHTYNHSLGHQFYLPAYYSLICFGLMTTCLAFGSRAKFVTDTIAGGFGVALAIVVCISTVAYKSSAMLDIIGAIFQKIANYSKHPHTHEAAQLMQLSKRFTTLISHANIDKFEEFFKNLDPKILSELFVNDENSHYQAEVIKINEIEVSQQNTSKNIFSFWSRKSDAAVTIPVSVQENLSRRCVLV